MRINVPEKAKLLMQKLEDNGFEAYIVGGYCRSMLMREDPKDVDIFTNAHGNKILEIFPQGKVIGGEERQKKILTVIVDEIEVSTYRKDGKRNLYGKTILEHQETSDLTINNICCDKTGKIDLENIHNKNGINDLGIYDFENNIWQDNCLIKFVGNPLDRINEDKLRILRALRFASQYNANFDNESLQEIRNKMCKLRFVPKERIRDELIKCLKYANCIDILNKTSALINMFPKYNKVINLHGGDNHDETVDQHMIYSFKEACKITDDWRIRLCAFLHDIGKGQCVSNDSETGIHFYQHEKIGAEIVEEWMTHMKFSKDDIKFVSTLVRYHMWSYKAGEISKKAYIRMFNKFHEVGVSIYDFMIIIFSDHQGNQSKKRIKFGDFCKGSWILNRYWECVHQKEPFSKKDLELQGGDIIKLLNKEPGKWVGDLMDEIFEAVMNCELVNDKREIIKWINKL